MRSRRVFLLMRKLPRRDLPAMKVNPKNWNVSGLPSPFALLPLHGTGVRPQLDVVDVAEAIDPLHWPHRRDRPIGDISAYLLSV
jgi:hypothetical protein